MPAKVIDAPRRSRKPLFTAPLLMASAALLLIASSALSAQTSPSTEGSPAASSASAGAPAVSSASAAAPPLRFDVVSIHQNKSGSLQMVRQSSAHSDGITMRNVPPFAMILYAYYGEIKTENLLTAPDWTKTERYDVIAKIDPSEVPAYQKLTNAQRAAMFQKVLADRFKLRLHREMRDSPAYALVVAKGGPKLKEAKPGESYPKGEGLGHGFAHGGRFFAVGPGQLMGEGASMADLAGTLSDLNPSFLGGRMVVDRTGLTGKYDFTFQLFPPEEAGAGSDDADGQQRASTIITAVQQLGLKLQPSTAPVEQFVVDHIERPSEN